MVAANTNNNQRYVAKPPMFDGEKFDYQRDRESFFPGYDIDFWEMVTNDYKDPVSAIGIPIPMNKMNEDQKRNFKNHHKAKTILLSTISYNEYEKITKR